MADDRPFEQPTAADPGSAAVASPDLLRRVFGAGYEEICRYRDVLASRGIDWGVIGPREIDRLWGRHILNSASVTELIPTGVSVADVGAGAGLPGIPVAIRRPDLRIDLIEPLLRRCNFLTHIVDELGITARVAVRRARADEVSRRYETVLSRALAPLDRLIRWCLPLIEPDGQILAIKGVSAGDEIDRHSRLIAGSGLTAEVVTVRCDPAVAPTTVVRLRLR